MINIVMPCYNRIHLLEKTLKSFKKFNIKYPITLLYDGELIPRDFKLLADKYNTNIEASGKWEGANDNIYKCIIKYDTVLVIDSDVIIKEDFTNFIDNNINRLEDENISGISISDSQPKFNSDVEGVMIKKTNHTTGTIYKRSHIDKAYKLWRENKDSLWLDGASSLINTQNKHYFICSPIIFLEHIGNDKDSLHPNLVYI